MVRNDQGEDEAILIDEALTPDSSRFWDVAIYQPGQAQPSFDKQPLRDWLESTGWDKTPPAPAMPSAVVALLQERYAQGFERITGRQLLRRRPADVPRYRAEIHVTLKRTVNDPQGLTIKGGLHSLGYAGVDAVRAGKYIEVWLDAPDEAAAASQVDAMCDQLPRQPRDRGLPLRCVARDRRRRRPLARPFTTGRTLLCCFQISECADSGPHGEIGRTRLFPAYECNFVQVKACWWRRVRGAFRRRVPRSGAVGEGRRSAAPDDHRGRPRPPASLVADDCIPRY